MFITLCCWTTLESRAKMYQFSVSQYTCSNWDTFGQGHVFKIGPVSKTFILGPTDTKIYLYIFHILHFFLGQAKQRIWRHLFFAENERRLVALWLGLCLWCSEWEWLYWNHRPGGPGTQVGSDGTKSVGLHSLHLQSLGYGTFVGKSRNVTVNKNTKTKQNMTSNTSKGSVLLIDFTL